MLFRPISIEKVISELLHHNMVRLMIDESVKDISSIHLMEQVFINKVVQISNKEYQESNIESILNLQKVCVKNFSKDEFIHMSSIWEGYNVIYYPCTINLKNNSEQCSPREVVNYDRNKTFFGNFYASSLYNPSIVFHEDFIEIHINLRTYIFEYKNNAFTNCSYFVKLLGTIFIK